MLAHRVSQDLGRGRRESIQAVSVITAFDHKDSCAKLGIACCEASSRLTLVNSKSLPLWKESRNRLGTSSFDLRAALLQAILGQTCFSVMLSAAEEVEDVHWHCQEGAHSKWPSKTCEGWQRPNEAWGYAPSCLIDSSLQANHKPCNVQSKQLIMFVPGYLLCGSR